MMLDLLTAICFVLMVNDGQGSTVPICNSYRAIQRLRCLDMRMPTQEESARIFTSGYLTRDGLEVFLGVWCSSLTNYRDCISANTEQCTNQEELQQLSLENGGLCTSAGTVDPQVQPFLEMYEQVVLNDGECARSWRRSFDSCYPQGYSEIPDRPHPSMTIAEGIDWWRRTRTDTVSCIVNMDMPTLHESCVGMSTRDAKIFAVIDNLWSEPYGVGAHVDITSFINLI